MPTILPTVFTDRLTVYFHMDIYHFILPFLHKKKKKMDDWKGYYLLTRHDTNPKKFIFLNEKPIENTAGKKMRKFC